MPTRRSRKTKTDAETQENPTVVESSVDESNPVVESDESVDQKPDDPVVKDTKSEEPSTTETTSNESTEPISYEYVRVNHVLTCKACNKQAARGLNTQPVCSSTRFPKCPRRN